jgi:hypothetical protein
MATTRKTKKTTEATKSDLTEPMVRDLVTYMVRDAIRTTSRELEQHLNDINTRLVALEKATRK